MTTVELIKKVQTAFQNVKLEDGVGLWEGQGLDDYSDKKTILELRKKDERNNWNDIPYKDISFCQSSLSFFDAKGMRFCLPKFLLFDILQEQIYQEQGISAPDVIFTLCYNINGEYQKSRFSLFSKQQIECIIYFLEYKLQKILVEYKECSTNSDSTTDDVYSDYDYIELNEAIYEWKQKIDSSKF
ncbi:MAG: hypothetical protein PHE33_09685 [Bacteroidales bacterium]|nr:hypothetical protein [Bacteroidales bacterium]